MRTESITKKDRVYLTSTTYLSKIKIGCSFLFVLSLVAGGAVIIVSGITIISLITSGIILGVGAFSCIYLLRRSSIASLKGGNIILKNVKNHSVVAPVGSIRKVKSGGVLGMKYTQVRYKVDGCKSSFLILGNDTVKTPEILIREEIANAKRKKMANHKPDSVLTRMA